MTPKMVNGLRSRSIHFQPLLVVLTMLFLVYGLCLVSFSPKRFPINDACQPRFSLSSR